jgi:hypothetical protein
MRQVGADYLREEGRCRGERSIFGNAGDVNRAKAIEMYEPVLKMKQRRQLFISGAWRKIRDFVIDKDIAHKSLKPATNRTYDFNFNAISAGDMQKSGLTMPCLAQSLAMAVKQDWIKDEGAARSYAEVALMFGPNVEPVANPQSKPDAPTARRMVNPEKSPKPQVVK